MGLYDGFKDVLSVAQKADNIELYKQLLDFSYPDDQYHEQNNCNQCDHQFHAQ